MRHVLVASIVIAVGCASPTAIPGNDLKLRNDKNADGKEGAADDSNGQQTNTTTELGDGTPAPSPTPTPTPDPPRTDDGGTSSSGVECSFDADCALGTICLSSACKPGCYTDIDCPTGQSCTSGMCKVAPSGGTPPAGSIACVADGQCNPGLNGSGKICSAQGFCVDGCRADNQCPGVQTCVSGMCR